MNNGYIKLHRQMKDSKVWFYTHAQFRVWMTILLNVNWKESWGRFQGKEVKLDPGQMVTSRNHLVEESRTSKSVVRDTLTKLEQDDMIELKRSSEGTLLTVLNWGKYQKIVSGGSSDEGSGKGSDGGNDEGNKGGNREGSEGGTHEEYKEGEEQKDKPSEESGDSSSGADALPGNLDRVPRNLEEWQKRVNQSDNPQGLLGTMIKQQFPKNPEPEFARLGKLVKENDPALIAEVLWKNNGKIDGNVVDYITKALNENDTVSPTVAFNDGSEQSPDASDYVHNM